MFNANLKRALFHSGVLLYLSTITLLAQEVKFLPANNSIGNPVDVLPMLVFDQTPILHNQGKIRIFDALTGGLVDEVDMAISPGPRNTRTPAPYDSFHYPSIPDSVYRVNTPDRDASHLYQQYFIGSEHESDAYHYFPIAQRENKLVFYPHHRKLEYGGTYYITIEPGMIQLADGSDFAIENPDIWQFTIKNNPPPMDASQIIVAEDGTGDFQTIQGAVDYLNTDRLHWVKVLIKKGWYEEIVNFRGAKKVMLVGEDRDEVIVCYANNSVFNRRDETPVRGSHNVRAVLAVYNAEEVVIANLTLRSLGEEPAQAEGLLALGDKILVHRVNIEGSGDALQATGTIFVNQSKIQGFGDNVLGYGAVFFQDCDFVSTYGPHLWVRNTEENHGNVMVRCTLRTIGDVETHIARAPDNRGIKYKYCEAVLIECLLEGIKADGWGKVTDSTENIHYWEYGSKNLEDGKPIDASMRHPASRQLDGTKDKDLIEQYLQPAFILEGWKPQLAPVVLTPDAATEKSGSQTPVVSVISYPEPQYQWYRKNKIIKKERGSSLSDKAFKPKYLGTYSVRIYNEAGEHWVNF